jgi:hypothetical protein
MCDVAFSVVYIEILTASNKDGVKYACDNCGKLQDGIAAIVRGAYKCRCGSSVIESSLCEVCARDNNKQIRAVSIGTEEEPATAEDIEEWQNTLLAGGIDYDSLPVTYEGVPDRYWSPGE